MPTRKLQFKNGKFYHIYNRASKGAALFRDDSDKERFIQSAFLSNNSNDFRGVFALEKNRADYSVESAKKILESRKIAVVPLVDIFAFCIMPDHFHFLLRQKENNGVSRFMQRLGNSFGKYFSKKYSCKGSVFAGRFKSAAIDDKAQLGDIAGYINVINPAQLTEPYIRIKGVENFSLAWQGADNYLWSSHNDFLGRKSSGIVFPGALGRAFNSPKAYNDFAQEILLGKKINIWDRLKGVSLD